MRTHTKHLEEIHSQGRRRYVDYSINYRNGEVYDIDIEKHDVMIGRGRSKYPTQEEKDIAHNELQQYIAEYLEAKGEVLSI